MSLQEESGKIEQAVKGNNIVTLTEMITSGVDVNAARVTDAFGVSAHEPKQHSCYVISTVNNDN